MQLREVRIFCTAWSPSSPASGLVLTACSKHVYTQGGVRESPSADTVCSGTTVQNLD